VGTHLTDDPNTHVPFVMHNCALCHSEAVKWPGGEKVVLGIGHRHIRIHAFEDALAKIANAPDFDRAHLGPLASRIAEEKGIPWSLDSRSVVGRTVDATKERATTRATLLERTRDGLPGRVATIESFAVALGPILHRDVTTSKTIGWARIPDTIGFSHTRTLSWDGGSEGPSDALVVDADIAAGTCIKWLQDPLWQGASLATFLRHMPRDLPFPGRIDAQLARRGKASFEKACAKCHGTYEDDGRAKTYVEPIIPIGCVDSDPARALAVTDDFVAAANDPRLAPGFPMVVRHEADVRLRAPGPDERVGARAVRSRRAVAESRGTRDQTRRAAQALRRAWRGAARPRASGPRDERPGGTLGPGDDLQDGALGGDEGLGAPGSWRTSEMILGASWNP
jgi:hypothetical protein